MDLIQRDAMKFRLKHRDAPEAKSPVNMLTCRSRDCAAYSLADRTNGRAYATVLRRSSSVRDVVYCG